MTTMSSQPALTCTDLRENVPGDRDRSGEPLGACRVNSFQCPSETTSTAPSAAAHPRQPLDSERDRRNGHTESTLIGTQPAPATCRP